MMTLFLVSFLSFLLSADFGLRAVIVHMINLEGEGVEDEGLQAIAVETATTTEHAVSASLEGFPSGNVVGFDNEVFPDLPDLDWDSGEDAGEEYDEEGFLKVSPECHELWFRIQGLLSELGLTGERLILQQAEVPRLLSQLLEELEVGATKLMRDFLTARLYNDIQAAIDEEARRKKFRGIPSVPLQRIHDAAFGIKGLDKEMEVATSLFFYPSKGKRGRGGRPKPNEQGVLTRELAEREQRSRWEGLLSKILTDGGTPTYELAIRTKSPAQALIRAAGKTRPSTLKGYLKKWLKMACWLQRATGQCWPRDLESALDYVEVLAENVHPTVPQATLQALQWVEKAGGYRGEDSIFTHPSVIRSFDNLTVEAGSKAQAKKQAPRYPFVLIAAAELFGTDPGTPVMKRIHANSLVFRAMGTLRLDDLQNMDRKRIRKMGAIYVTELLRSKTSGPGKRNAELPVAISADATLLGTDWILRFLEDLEETSPGPSDFLLFSSSYNGFMAKPKMKSYEEASADTRQIVGALRVPTLRNGKWVASDDPVIPQCCIGAIKEHGGRSVLPSAAVSVEPDKSKRDMLGKWLVTGGSVDYTRSYRANVARMQLDILEAVKSGRLLTDMREDDIFDQYTRHLVEGKGWERRAAEELIGRTFHRWDVFYKELAGWAKDQVKIVSEDSVPIDIPEAPVSFPCKKPVSEYRFMIVYERP